jgi:ABC-type bacteriocin/lantibiotic exporter with double-glycine peptidase domain
MIALSKMLAILSLLIYTANYVQPKSSDLNNRDVILERLSVNGDAPLLCGVNALYITTRILKGNYNNLDYRYILSAFPNVLIQGTNLIELEKFLSREGYACKLTKLSELKIAKMKPPLVAIVLIKNENNSQNIKYHFIVKSPDSTGGLHVFDPPNKYRSISKEGVSSVSMPTLVVAANNENILSNDNFKYSIIIYSVTLLAVFFSFIFICASYIRNRVSNYNV